MSAQWGRHQAVLSLEAAQTRCCNSPGELPEGGSLERWAEWGQRCKQRPKPVWRSHLTGGEGFCRDGLGTKCQGLQNIRVLDYILRFKKLLKICEEKQDTGQSGTVGEWVWALSETERFGVRGFPIKEKWLPSTRANHALRLPVVGFSGLFFLNKGVKIKRDHLQMRAPLPAWPGLP